ncbi:MAG: ASPIC/UnbV domain-containing protein, partial [Opitutales bacterium]|nr:ASPIC/UnbV domain-containing protein [Opitutales bacterium]
MGNGKYANISSVSGLDLIDDGRALAHCDWDWDGKPDFWTTNRTGPRIHFLHNQMESSNNFISIRLKGTKSNRDAIGARIELIIGKEHPPIIKTLQGGSGFLSQSSKWLHFGIAKVDSIE